jgi:hypothetical protein
LVISVRACSIAPTTAASAGSGIIGFMNAGFGLRFAPLRFFLETLAILLLLGAFLAELRFFPADFFPFFFAM